MEQVQSYCASDRLRAPVELSAAASLGMNESPHHQSPSFITTSFLAEPPAPISPVRRHRRLLAASHLQRGHPERWRWAAVGAKPVLRPAPATEAGPAPAQRTGRARSPARAPHT